MKLLLDTNKRSRAALLNGILAFALGMGVMPMAADSFVNDPEHPRMRAATTLWLEDEDAYGAGPMLHPAQTYHVSPDGDDGLDGLSPDTAWRGLQHAMDALRAGDTLWIHEGEYTISKPLTMPGGAERDGRAGAPIRLMAQPGARVLIRGGTPIDDWQPVPGYPDTYASQWQSTDIPLLWEADSHIEMQFAGTLERVAELPGTYGLDADSNRLIARFTRIAEGRPPVAQAAGAETGLDIRASYVLVSGLTFMNFEVGLFVRPGARHVTVEQCDFFANHKAGIQLSSTSHCLIRDNTAWDSGTHGSLFMHNPPRVEPDLADNLIVRNHFNSTPGSIRTGGRGGYAIHHWNGSGSRNHIIDNLLTGDRSLWYKPMHRQVVVQGNVMTGGFDSEMGTRSIATMLAQPVSAEDDDAITVRNNTLLAGLNWGLEIWGPGGPGADWSGGLKTFVNNLHTDKAEFVDPAYHDYRLQHQASASADQKHAGRGAAAIQSVGQAYFIDGEKGNDGASGRSVGSAWRSLAQAVNRLQPGDTLYLLGGNDAEQLIIENSGQAGHPIQIRAHGRSAVRVAEIDIRGNHITVDGLSVIQAARAAVRVSGSAVRLNHLLLADYADAGIRAADATDLEIQHATLIGPAPALILEAGCHQVSVRDSILVAANNSPVLQIDPGCTDFRSSHNVYWSQVDTAAAYAGVRDIHADPRFKNPAAGDYSLEWNSPAGAHARFGQAAGALPLAPRPIAIKQAEATAIQPDSAIILWRTPHDDSHGKVRWRQLNSTEWLEVHSPEQGTVHGAGLTGLQPEQAYEFQVIAEGRRGGSGTSPIYRFHTSAEPSPASVYYLSPQGNDQNDGLTPETAWRSPRRASQAVAAGDTVRILAGDYHHVIAPLRSGLPGRRITFEGYGKGTARFDGSGVTAPLVILDGLDHITLRNLDFDIGTGRLRPGRSLPAPSPGGVIRLKDCRDIELIGCRGGSLEPLGMGGGTHFINTYNVDGLLIEHCISWGARYHMRINMPPPPSERRPDDPVPLMRGLTMRNNTFVHSQIQAFVIDGRSEDILIYNNIYYRPCGMATKDNPIYLFRDRDRPDWSSDYNLFFSPIDFHQRIGEYRDENRRIVLEGTDLASWQAKTGQDLHSFRANPMFVDIDSGDFRLLPDSPAIGAGKDGATIGALGVAE